MIGDKSVPYTSVELEKYNPLKVKVGVVPVGTLIVTTHQPTPARTIYYKVYRYALRRRFGVVGWEVAKFLDHNDRRSKTSFSYKGHPLAAQQDCVCTHQCDNAKLCIFFANQQRNERKSLLGKEKTLTLHKKVVKSVGRLHETTLFCANHEN